MDNSIEYKCVSSYTMKCRLYPNKETAKKIDDILVGIRVFYNCTLWEIFNNYQCTTEAQDKKEPDKVVHFVRPGEICKAEYKNRLIAEHPIISVVPAGALSSNVYGISVDIAKSLGKTPIEYQKPKFYNSKHPRRSYSYQETFSKISVKDNRNVLYFNLAKVGIVKLRGWNTKIRFDEEGTIDFLDYVSLCKKGYFGATVSKDNIGNYWFCFKLQNVYLPIKTVADNKVGVDVGIKDILITSDGEKYPNYRFKDKEKKHIRCLNRRLSRRCGWANEEYRKQHKADADIIPSKSYENTQLKLAKLHQKIANQRNNCNNRITKQIIENNAFIGTETLNVAGMYRNRRLANALSDAAMGEILQMLKYKADWYKRILVPIDQWSPSSKRCSNCGYIRPKLSLDVREWTCPECGSYLDRDINAAQNILYYAEQIAKE